MAHFAQIDADNTVSRVIAVNDADAPSEAVGGAFCAALLGGVWMQTSYHGHIRKNYAGAGYSYHPEIDAFVAPKPDAFPSFVLDPATATWTPPVPRPQTPPPNGTTWEWNEASQAWQGEVG